MKQLSQRKSGYSKSRDRKKPARFYKFPNVSIDRAIWLCSWIKRWLSLSLGADAAHSFCEGLPPLRSRVKDLKASSSIRAPFICLALMKFQSLILRVIIPLTQIVWFSRLESCLPHILNASKYLYLTTPFQIDLENIFQNSKDLIYCSKTVFIHTSAVFVIRKWNSLSQNKLIALLKNDRF